ncbi:MAG: endonuclease/exonuclease/phosphatase family protein [Hyphomonas sp.]
MRALLVSAALVALAVLYLLLAGWMTLTDKTIPISRQKASGALAPAGQPLVIMTWNIGYAGLGEESDFKADGGEMLQPPSKDVVRKNLAGIQEVLRAEQPDVVLMQELAGPGFLTRGVNVVGGVHKALADYVMTFSSDIRTRWLPGPMSLRHGLGTFLRVANNGTEIVRIAEEPGPIMGFIKRRYHVQVTELDVAGQPWTLINVHLSAFDEGADTRMVQLRQVLDLAKSYHEAGRAVVVGGDWNMRLAATDFAYSASDEAQFWLHDFPKAELAEGWQIAIDPAVASVRTNEQPYVYGVNYTTNIDGLIVSPNVQIESARGIDLGFRFTDHQPVVLTLRHKEG